MKRLKSVDFIFLLGGPLLLLLGLTVVHKGFFIDGDFTGLAGLLIIPVGALACYVGIKPSTSNRVLYEFDESNRKNRRDVQRYSSGRRIKGDYQRFRYTDNLDKQRKNYLNIKYSR